MSATVLIVDDAREIRVLFRTVLSPHYTTFEACSGANALEMARQYVPDVVLLDLAMDGLDGYETCRRLRLMPELQSTRVIVVSAHSNAEDLQRAFDAGADDFVVKPVNPYELLSRVQLHMRLHSTLQLAVDLQSLTPCGEQLARAELDRSQEILAGTLLKLAENRDNETGQHLIQMREFTVLLAEELKRGSEYADQIDDSFITDLDRACPLHDIGKVGIPDEVLQKPGKLTPEEFDVMKEHTTIGANILEQAVVQMNGRGFLVMAMDIARSHHERWDGRGYPRGLAGIEIPLAARIVAVADVYDALTSERCYKEAWTPARAKQTIEEGAGTQFDPVVVDAFRRCFADFLTTQSKYVKKDEAASITPASCSRQLAVAS